MDQLSAMNEWKINNRAIIMKWSIEINNNYSMFTELKRCDWNAK